MVYLISITNLLNFRTSEKHGHILDETLVKFHREEMIVHVQLLIQLSKFGKFVHEIVLDGKCQPQPQEVGGEERQNIEKIGENDKLYYILYYILYIVINLCKLYIHIVFQI